MAAAPVLKGLSHPCSTLAGGSPGNGAELGMKRHNLQPPFRESSDSLRQQAASTNLPMPSTPASGNGVYALAFCAISFTPRLWPAGLQRDCMMDLGRCTDWNSELGPFCMELSTDENVRVAVALLHFAVLESSSIGPSLLLHDQRIRRAAGIPEALDQDGVVFQSVDDEVLGDEKVAVLADIFELLHHWTHLGAAGPPSRGVLTA